MRFEPLAIRVHETDQCDGCIADGGCDRRQIVVGCLLQGIQDLEFPANANARPANLISGYAENVSVLRSLAELGFLIEEADRLIERARYP